MQQNDVLLRNTQKQLAEQVAYLRKLKEVDPSDVLASETLSEVFSANPNVDLEVEVTGLSSELGKKLNGQRGKISRKNDENGRWIVVIHDEEVQLQEKNITVSSVKP